MTECRRSNVLKYVGWLMVLSFPAGDMAAEPSALLSATGKVRVNDNVVPRSATIFFGDRIRTAGRATGTVTARGSTVFVGGNSALVYAQTGLELDCGSMLVSTTMGLGARTGEVRVSPVSGQAKYAMLHKDGKVEIAAREGDLEVENGSQRLSLVAGKELSLPGGCMVRTAAGRLPPVAQGRSGLWVGLPAVAGATAIAIVETPESSPSRPSR